MTRMMSGGVLLATALVSGIGISLVVASVRTRAATPDALATAMPGQRAVKHVDHQARHQEALRRHGLEERDDGWSEMTSNKLRTALHALGATRAFRVERVDCRTKTCVAYLEWANYQASIERYQDLLHHDFAVRCGREITLPRPTETGVRYQATMIFDCDRSDVETKPRQGTRTGP